MHVFHQRCTSVALIITLPNSTTRLASDSSFYSGLHSFIFYRMLLFCSMWVCVKEVAGVSEEFLQLVLILHEGSQSY